MPQSLSSIERDNPPPRRKSCLACTKARRRCDQASPACQRCAQRNIDCQYPQGARSRRGPVVVSTPGQTSPSTSMPNAEEQMESLLDLIETPHVSSDNLGSILDTSTDFFSNNIPASLDWNDVTRPPDDSQSLVNPGSLVTTQHALDPSQLVVDSQIRRVIASRFQYTIDKMLAAPYQMVLENQTPWCHIHLYADGMPRSMQDAVSSAALHAARNDANSRIVRECIESRVQDLLSSPVPTAPIDLIARAHALFIYQILRSLDKDVRVRLSYDATMSQLEEAAFSLLPHISFHDPSLGQTCYIPDDLPLYPIAATRDFWRSWILQESARRTLSIILFFVLMYHYMRGEPSQCGKNTYACRSVTLSAHLWHARDPVDFALAWMNRKHFIVHSAALDTMATVMEDAKTDDIEEYGKIFLTGLMGIDEAKGWLASRGITL